MADRVSQLEVTEVLVQCELGAPGALRAELTNIAAVVQAVAQGLVTPAVVYRLTPAGAERLAGFRQLLAPVRSCGHNGYVPGCEECERDG